MKKILLNDNAIYIGSGLIDKINEIINLDSYSKILIVFDERMKKSARFLDAAFHLSISINEKQKNLESVQKIWKKLMEIGADRKSLIINIGGGTLCDVSSFAASTYMRGIDFVNVPTTLLAQVDAGIGGKNGINFGGIKNIIGTFKDPIAVIIDVNFLKTLPEREFLSGFAEIIKHGLIFDKKYFETLKPSLKFTELELESIIEKSCKIKVAIVKKDPHEKNLRKILNFGHTIGHALEALSLENSKPLLHGEAIYLGMIVETRISYLAGLLKKKDFEIVDEFLRKFVKPIEFNSEKIYEKILFDKKNESGCINFTLIKSIGKAVFNQQVDKKIIMEALNYEND